MCGNFITKEKSQVKWLGLILSSLDFADSVLQTVGGMETALVLWERCCIPSMLHGAGTWVEMNQSKEKRLNSIQSRFVRLIYQVGQGSPVSALLWDNFC